MHYLLIILIVAVIGLGGGRVWAGENYNSSKSNTSTGIINRDVGNLLIGYGYGGEVVNQVTEALARGVTTDGLRAILSGTSARSPAVVEEVLQKLEVELVRLGIDAPEEQFTTGEEGVSTPNAGGAVPSAAEGACPKHTCTAEEVCVKGVCVPSSASEGTLKQILPSKRAEPAPALKKVELMQNTIGKIQGRLKDCDNIKVCDIVERHARSRTEIIVTIKEAIANRNLEEATRLLREVRGIVVGDIELLREVFVGDFSRDGKSLIADVLGLERALLNQTDSTLMAVSVLKPAAGTGEQRFKSVDGLDSETRSGGFIKLGDLPGEQATFKDSATKSIQDLKAAESREQREKITQELSYRRVLLQQGVQALRQNLRENAQELRDNFRERSVRETTDQIEKLEIARIAVAHGKGLRMINRYRSAMARFDHILGRMESRIEKIGIENEAQARSQGTLKEVLPSEVVLYELTESAKNTQVLNKAKLAELEAKYESLLLGKNPGGIAEEARAIAKELKAEIEKLHGLLDEIQQSATDYNSSVSNSSSTL